MLRLINEDGGRRPPASAVPPPARPCSSSRRHGRAPSVPPPRTRPAPDLDRTVLVPTPIARPGIRGGHRPAELPSRGALGRPASAFMGTEDGGRSHETAKPPKPPTLLQFFRTLAQSPASSSHPPLGHSIARPRYPRCNQNAPQTAPGSRRWEGRKATYTTLGGPPPTLVLILPSRCRADRNEIVSLIYK